ncbi:protein disulfide-isomerase precursor [Rhizophlyctis rosea]|uniref:Protein disulfide-isomerase n=1 Tax=Rhizophlyctis rosea TaxID=64517 RepID=A0AAD5X2K9_9FUNG|nr:protein disulfide-isomerase precursor [Rhizophlyctis rosea]
MKTSANLLIALLALVGSGRADASAESAAPVDSDVVVLGKALAPEYEKAATELKSDDIPIAKVDCTVETEICEEHKIQGFPTLKIFRKGASSEFKGQRKADSIVSVLKKQALPAISELTADKVESFSASDRVVVIAYVKSGSSEYKAFESVAEKHRDDFVFGYTSDKAAAKAAGVSIPSVVLYKKFDEGKNEFDGKDLTSDAIESFVKVNSVPTMDDIGPENFQSYVDSGLPLAYLFVGSDSDRTTYGPVVEPLAKAYKGKINFVYLDATKYGAHGKNLNLKESWPAFALSEPKKNLKYPFDQEAKMEAGVVEAFVKSFVDGKLEPSLKSEAVPESNDGPVKVIVGKTYNEIVNDTGKDVLVEFYAPWCGHCKRLAPIYEELGEKFKDIENIVIAKIDATENDLPADTPFTIEGFPTLKLIKAKDNTVVSYEGDRTLEDLAKFVKENAVHGSEVQVEVEEKEEEVVEEADAASPAAEATEGHDEL